MPFWYRFFFQPLAQGHLQLVFILKNIRPTPIQSAFSKLVYFPVLLFTTYKYIFKTNNYFGG